MHPYHTLLTNLNFSFSSISIVVVSVESASFYCLQENDYQLELFYLQKKSCIAHVVANTGKNKGFSSG